MTTINTSEEAYKRILKRKQKMEEASGRVVPVAKALDALLGVKEELKPSSKMLKILGGLKEE